MLRCSCYGALDRDNVLRKLNLSACSRTDINARQRLLGSRESGTALITVLLIWAVATFIVADMFGQLDIDRRRTIILLAQDQAYLYALSAEEAIIALLLEDHRSDLDSDSGLLLDHKGEQWYELNGFEQYKRFTMPGDGAVVTSNLVDLQQRFNLNDLKNDSAQAQRRFRSLLTDLDLPKEGDVARVVSAVQDWLDEDDEPREFDSEDLYYSNLEKPYRTANDYMASVSELQLINGLTMQDVAKLAPFVTVLPEGVPTNINTVSSRVLSTFDGIDNVAQVLGVQEQGGFERVADAFEGFDNPPPAQWFSIFSSYFLLSVESELAGTRVTLRSIIYRPETPNVEDPVRVVYRDRARVYRILENQDG